MEERQRKQGTPREQTPAVTEPLGFELSEKRNSLAAWFDIYMQVDRRAASEKGSVPIIVESKDGLPLG